MVRDIASMKAHYRALLDLNRDLALAHERRIEKYDELSSHLRTLNGLIQCATRLRRGPQADAVALACRAAVQGQDRDAFVRALHHH